MLLGWTTRIAARYVPDQAKDTAVATPRRVSFSFGCDPIESWGRQDSPIDGPSGLGWIRSMGFVRLGPAPRGF